MQVQLLMIVHHRNLVSLIAYCDEHGNMALVYEYMANGNLREHLSGRKEHKFVELERKASNCSRRSTRFRSSGNLNKKSDVYSFGILLLELRRVQHSHPSMVQRADMSYVLIELKECLAMEVSSERTLTQNRSTRMRDSIEMNLVLVTDMAPHAR
ncbi:unnamed protein product [Dovyalis caffra]|uniref:Protein kinase domain-containing protein n=1 Tax=Dovyalis caffra TaxID=77055 RepID=A0AAV1QNW2_9ROSI|nr:unnamed protein product [Dovyalis caffra]